MVCICEIFYQMAYSKIKHMHMYVGAMVRHATYVELTNGYFKWQEVIPTK